MDYVKAWLKKLCTLLPSLNIYVLHYTGLSHDILKKHILDKHEKILILNNFTKYGTVLVPHCLYSFFLSLSYRSFTNLCLFPQMYFNASINSTTKLLKPLLVFAFCMAAGLAGLTQITQHRSHPIDVYVGYLIGAGIGVYLVSL